MTLSEVPLGTEVAIEEIRGERGFRRRLLELGLLPGRRIKVVRVAPLGDPLQLEAGGTQLSIRAQEAAQISVRDPATTAQIVQSPAANSSQTAERPASCCE